MRGEIRSKKGSCASVPTADSGTPPVATTSRSLSPASVSIDEWKEPVAAAPARSIASTTATPSAMAKIVSAVRTGSRNRGRTSKR
jgi:hypothetical protein